MLFARRCWAPANLSVLPSSCPTNTRLPNAQENLNGPLGSFMTSIFGRTQPVTQHFHGQMQLGIGSPRFTSSALMAWRKTLWKGGAGRVCHWTIPYLYVLPLQPCRSNHHYSIKGNAPWATLRWLSPSRGRYAEILTRKGANIPSADAGMSESSAMEVIRNTGTPYSQCIREFLRCHLADHLRSSHSMYG